jgi:endonuclease I
VLKNNEKIIYNTTEKIKINNHKNMEVDQYKLLTENVDIETMKTNANFLYFNRSTKIRGEPTAKVKFENAIQT